MEDESMFIKKILGIVAATCVAISFSAPDANAFHKVHNKHVRQVSFLKHTRSHAQGAMAPFAYIQFCVHHRSSCSNTKGRLAMSGSNNVKLTSRLQLQLASINSRVNSRIRPKSDVGSDKWSIGGRAGDCEDYAMTKRALLIAAGWPSRALSLTVVKTSWGEGHAILSVHTSQGTLVLDNLSRSVKSLRAVPYKIVEMQAGSAMKWTRRSDL
jgi:predicted transglutaminase-like cysteine proteinase